MTRAGADMAAIVVLAALGAVYLGVRLWVRRETRRIERLLAGSKRAARRAPDGWRGSDGRGSDGR
jgi:hypothetical protein